MGKSKISGLWNFFIYPQAVRKKKPGADEFCPCPAIKIIPHYSLHSCHSYYYY